MTVIDRSSLLSCFPYPEPRPVQEELLRQIEEHWASSDVFVINAPTALGKSAIARSLMTWQPSSSYLVPTNQLLRQFLAEFPDTQALHRVGSYECSTLAASCVSRHRLMNSFCQGCPLQTAQDIALEEHQIPLATNFHVYYTRLPRIRRYLMIVDEAHQLIPVLQDMRSIFFWKHKEKYPDNWTDLERMRDWLEDWEDAREQKYRKKGKPLPKLPAWVEILKEGVLGPSPQYVLEEGIGVWNGGWQDIPRGEPVELPILKLKPIDIRDLDETALMLPSGRRAGKIVLMSATIGPKDIEQLGLDRRRVTYLSCSSPIPASSRPTVYQPVASASKENLVRGTEEMYQYIINELAPYHSGQKGLIHATYEQADLLRRQIPRSNRFLFHTKEDKLDVLAQFINSPVGDGQILVASGMYEGLDLPYDLARWQVITKIPWISLADVAVRYKADREPDWYYWETLKKLIQACGRVCRTPTDMGITYILDSTMSRLWRDGAHLAPQWWLDAVNMDSR